MLKKIIIWKITKNMEINNAKSYSNIIKKLFKVIPIICLFLSKPSKIT